MKGLLVSLTQSKWWSRKLAIATGVEAFLMERTVSAGNENIQGACIIGLVVVAAAYALAQAWETINTKPVTTVETKSSTPAA